MTPSQKTNIVEALKKAEHFFAFPEEYDGPEQADIHCCLTDAITLLQSETSEVDDAKN